MWKLNKNILSQFDFLSIILIIPIILTSNWLIGEIVPSLAQKQIAYMSIAVLAFFFVFIMPIRKMSWFIPIIYWINIILLISVEFFGHSRLGAQRWIEIPFINITMQPSEFVKPALVLMLAYLINKRKPPEYGYGIKDFLILSFYILLPFSLIAIQPDLGTALVLLLLGYGVLFLVGVSWKIWITIITIVLFVSPLTYKTMLHDYQKTRIKDFLSDKPSYHVKQSMIAIGSGGLMGNTKEEATQTQMKFLPISTSDFIFAALVERSGFIGGLAIIVVYILLILHLFSIAIYEQDYFIKVVSSSISFLIFIYMCVNISMIIGYAPVVGVPLPMFSYGGSSYMTFAILFAMMQNLITFRFKDMYDSEGTKSFI